MYDFVGTRDALPPDTQITSYVDANAPAQTAQDVALGQQLGQQVAQQLVARLRAAGIDAYPVGSGPVPKVGDVVVRGEFVSVDTGSRSMRMLVGFGAGARAIEHVGRNLPDHTELDRKRSPPRKRTRKAVDCPACCCPSGLAAWEPSAALSGASNVMQERGPESIRAAAQRTADGIADSIIGIYRERGWK